MPLVQHLLVAVRRTVAIIMSTHIVRLFARCIERIDVNQRVRKVRVVQEIMAHFCRDRMTTSTDRSGLTAMSRMSTDKYFTGESC